MAFKKNVENIIFQGYFHSKEIIAKVILLFTCSYFSKDNPLMARKGGEFKGLRCKGSGPGGIVLCQLKRQNSVFCVFAFLSKGNLTDWNPDKTVPVQAHRGTRRLIKSVTCYSTVNVNSKSLHGNTVSCFRTLCVAKNAQTRATQRPQLTTGKINRRMLSGPNRRLQAFKHLPAHQLHTA